MQACRVPHYNKVLYVDDEMSASVTQLLTTLEGESGW